DRAREAHREVQLAAGRPAAGFAEAGDGAVGAHADTRPLHLAGVVVHRGAQVDQHVRRLVLLEGVAVHAHARAGGEFGAHAVVVQGDGVVAGFGALAVVREARGV